MSKYYKPKYEDLKLGDEYEYLYFDWFSGYKMYDIIPMKWFKATLDSFDFTMHKRPPTKKNIDSGYIRCKLY